MKRAIFRLLFTLVWPFVLLSKRLSRTRFIPDFWRGIYSSSMMGAGFSSYFNKHYQEAAKCFEEVLEHGEEYEIEMVCVQLGKIYDEGLDGVPVDKDKAAECFLRAGYNGDYGYLHKYAVKQCHDKHK